MIFQSEGDDGRKFKHLQFFENCNDDPLSILALVEKLFAEIAQMPKHNWKGQTWFMRCYPEIERFKVFDGPDIAQVRCRFTTEEVPNDPEPVILGFGKDSAQ